MALVDQVRRDIETFLQDSQELFFNERDLQMHLAVFLRASKAGYDDVDVEYYVPHTELRGYIWQSELRLDLVVREGNEYLPIELKYKTSDVTVDIPRFGEPLEDCQVMKYQGAQDLGMYDFWKDVRRIELIRQRFSNVKNGLALFLTNDKFYVNGPRATSNNANFSLKAGTHSKEKYWQNSQSRCAKDNPGFTVERDYAISWNTAEAYAQQQKIEQHYCIVTI
jgi:hypothetical protein